jgi:hypothetical protein
MVDMGFFILDLHQRFEPLHREQLPSYRGKPFTVYRGQGLCTKEFQKIERSQGSLITFTASSRPASIHSLHRNVHQHIDGNA